MTTVPRRRSRGMILRLSWGLGDQAVSSITNFAVTIYVARTLGATQFGAFSLAYVTYSFVLNASRGLATDPLMVRFSDAELPAWRRAVASSSGTAVVVGLLSEVVVLGVSALLSGTARGAFFALGLMLPGLLLQDSWRYAFFALGRGSRAFLNDSVWALAMVPGVLYLRETGHASVFSFVLVWGAAATVAAAVGPLQARVIPRPAAAFGWVSRHRDLGPRYLAENTSNSGASQLRSYGVGILVGLAAVGYVQAANTLMGPFLVVFMGMSLVTIPEAARILRRSPQHLQLFCLLVGGGLAAGGLAWGGFLLVALPRGFGAWLLGPIWRPTYALVLPLTISVLGGCLIGGATAGLHALGAARRSLRAMVVSAATYLVCGLAGAAEGGAVGTMRGAAVATWIGAAVWWWQLRTALREADILTARKGSLRLARPHRLGAEGVGPHRPAAADVRPYRLTAQEFRPCRPNGDNRLGREGIRRQLSPLRPGESGGAWRQVPANVHRATGRSRSAAGLSEGIVSLRFIGAAIRRRARLCCALAMTGLVIGAGLYIALPPPYEASTSLVLAPPPGVNPTDAVEMDTTLAQSVAVARRAMAKLGVTESVTKFLASYVITSVTDDVLLITMNGRSSSEAVRGATAVAAAFLQFRADEVQAQQQLAIASLDDEMPAARQKAANIASQITRVSVRRASRARKAELGHLRTQLNQANRALTGLELAATSDIVTTSSTVSGSEVLDAAAPLQRSRFRIPVLYAAAGLITGLTLGLAVAIVGGLTTDRLRRRADVARALGAPVRLSVRRLRLGRRGLAAAHGNDMQQIIAYLRSAVPQGPTPATLAVIAVDGPREAALSLVALAVSYAREGRQVLVADLSAEAAAARLLGVSGPGVRAALVDDVQLTVALPEFRDIAAAGPLRSTPDPGHRAPGPALAGLDSAFHSADLLLTLATLDPALGAEHLATWTASAVVMLTAGQSSSAKIHAVGELIRLAYIRLVFAVLLGADKADQSLGMAEAPEAGSDADAAAECLTAG